MLFGFVLALNGFGADFFNNETASKPVAKAPQATMQTQSPQPITAPTVQINQVQPAPKITASPQTAKSPTAASKPLLAQPGAAIAATTPQPVPLIVPAPPPAPAPPPLVGAAAYPVNTKYGHFPYREASDASLSQVQGVWMHRETAQALRQMVADAKRSGADLVPVSGFRGMSLQSELFENQIARRGSIQQAALVSAPPGHSEHHTGYAIDIGDADNPATDVELSFEQTAAFRWLNQNAPRYGFEMSFPPGNAQGISYEPWHWRFVGSQASANVFAVARSR